MANWLQLLAGTLAGAGQGYLQGQLQKQQRDDEEAQRTKEEERWNKTFALNEAQNARQAEEAKLRMDALRTTADNAAFDRERGFVAEQVGAQTPSQFLTPELATQATQYRVPTRTAEVLKGVTTGGMGAGMGLTLPTIMGKQRTLSPVEQANEMAKTEALKQADAEEQAGRTELAALLRSFAATGGRMGGVSGDALKTPAQRDAEREADQADKLEQIRVDNQTRPAPASATLGPSGLSPAQLNYARQLRTNVRTDPNYQAFAQAQGAIQGASEALDLNTGVGDILAINLIQRGMVDPGVAVREGDVSLIRQASPVLDRFFSTFPVEKLKTGAILPPEARRQLKEVAQIVAQRKLEAFEQGAGQTYRKLAEANGIPFDMVFEGRGATPSADPSVSTSDVPPQVLAQGPGEHTFANGQVWRVSPGGKMATRIK